MKNRLIGLLAVAALSGCASMSTTQPTTLADTIARDPQLTTLNTLVTRAGLADTLKAAGPYTVFAPTDEAFKAVPAKTMDELAKDPARLKDVLNFHLLPAKVTAAEVKNGTVKTAQGANVALAKAGEFVTVE